MKRNTEDDRGNNPRYTDAGEERAAHDLSQQHHFARDTGITTLEFHEMNVAGDCRSAPLQRVPYLLFWTGYQNFYLSAHHVINGQLNN